MACRVCPVWKGYILALPIRRWFENPDKLLKPHIEKGMTVVDIGCAMGFFSLPMARYVGPDGRVICLDVQQRMLDKMMKRARRAKLDERIEARLCPPESTGIGDLSGKVGFATAYYVVHEVPDPEKLFDEVFDALIPGGRFFIREPKGHVSDESFNDMINDAKTHGFEVLENPEPLTVLLAKPR